MMEGRALLIGTESVEKFVLIENWLRKQETMYRRSLCLASEGQ